MECESASKKADSHDRRSEQGSTKLDGRLAEWDHGTPSKPSSATPLEADGLVRCALSGTSGTGLQVAAFEQRTRASREDDVSDTRDSRGPLGFSVTAWRRFLARLTST